MATQELPTTERSAPLFGPAITIGFLASVIMWMIAWVLHLPHIQVHTTIATTLMLAALFGVCLHWIRFTDASKRVQIGAIAGGVTGLVNLLILGSFIAEQPESTADMPEAANRMQPNAILVVVASLAASIAIGAIAGLIVKNTHKPAHSRSAWIARMGWVTALTYLPLIAVGGLVTSTDSGLAVPDGATTYGAVSVLFPLRLLMTEPRIFLEHSHRLFGTLAGLTTMVLMIRVLMGSSRKVPKALVVVLFIGVCIQGVMGALRVSEQSTFLAIVHGIFAQCVLVLAGWTAISLTEKWALSDPNEETLPLARKARMMMILAFALMFMQLCLGAVTRHMNSDHAMMTHAAFAFVVVSMIIISGSLCIRLGKSDESTRPIRPYGAIMHGLVVLQFTLGWAVLGLAWEGADAAPLPTSEDLASAPPIEPQALITTVHHLVGALLFAAVGCAAWWSIRLASKRRIG